MGSVIDSVSHAIVVEELEKLRQRIVANIASSGSNASGRTAKSLHVETDQDKYALYGRGYFGALETGRKEGKVALNFTEIITEWVNDKGWAFESVKDKMQTIQAICWKIRREGTKLHRSGGRNDIYSQEIPATIEAIKDRLLKAFVNEANVAQSIKINK